MGGRRCRSLDQTVNGGRLARGEEGDWLVLREGERGPDRLAETCLGPALEDCPSTGPPVKY